MSPAFVLALAAALGAPPAVQPTRIQLQSQGGWLLVGDYTRPESPSAVPAVLLLHGAARDRRAYAPLAADLVRRGVAALRLDLRGEGESTNLGRFVPGESNRLLEGTEWDVVAALAWLRSQPGIDPERIGVLGASYSGEAMAAAVRAGASAAAYVALSPGSFSDESARAIDASGTPWWFIASEDERFANVVVRSIPALSRTARVTFVKGTSHASDILSPHHMLNQEIADWFAAKLSGRAAPELWGGLQPGAYGVGFRRHSVGAGSGALVVDVWYPARGRHARMRFQDYLRLSTDLRPVAGADTPRSMETTLATAMSGEAGGVPIELARRILGSAMQASLDPPGAPGRFPLVLWTPRYATTVAQATLSEYLASLGFVVAFPRPASGGRLPFELPTPGARTGELQARIGDMRAAVAHLQSQPNVDAGRIGVVAWSYTGEMATGFQLLEPRVALVAGLSTTLLNDWVFQPAEAIDALEASRLTAAYAVLTQRGPSTGQPPAALQRAAAGYFIEFPGLAHGSFNALEGHIPSLMGISNVQRWSLGSAAGAAGYEAVAVILSRLLRHHLEAGGTRPLAPLPLLSGIADGVAEARRRE